MDFDVASVGCCPWAVVRGQPDHGLLSADGDFPRVFSQNPQVSSTLHTNNPTSVVGKAYYARGLNEPPARPTQVKVGG